MALRSFAYDDLNYTLVRQRSYPPANVASATAFAIFRSRVKVVVSSITLIVTSAASATKVIFIAQRGGSTNTTFTLAKATSIGEMTVVSCTITLDSVGEALNLVHDEKGIYHVLYEYNVVPTGSLYSNQ